MVETYTNMDDEGDIVNFITLCSALTDRGHEIAQKGMGSADKKHVVVPSWLIPAALLSSFLFFSTYQNP